MGLGLCITGKDELIGIGDGTGEGEANGIVGNVGIVGKPGNVGAGKVNPDEKFGIKTELGVD